MSSTITATNVNSLYKGESNRHDAHHYSIAHHSASAADVLSELDVVHLEQSAIKAFSRFSPTLPSSKTPYFGFERTIELTAQTLKRRFANSECRYAAAGEWQLVVNRVDAALYRQPAQIEWVTCSPLSII